MNSDLLVRVLSTRRPTGRFPSARCGPIRLLGPSYRLFAGPLLLLHPFPVFGQLPQIVTTSPLPAGVVGTPYSFTMQGTGGIAPYAWFDLGNTNPPPQLPPGLTLNRTTGVISGTPGLGGTYSTYIQICN